MAKFFDALKEIPSLPKEFILKGINDSKLDPRIVSHFYPRAPISEQYRRLRENLKTISRQNNFNTFAVTSAVHDEGKTVTALNLAVTMARDIDCKNILLVDCDLRRGSIDRALGFFNSPAGLSEYLSIGADLESIVYKTAVDKLSMVPRGKIADHPAELLASQKMTQLLKQAAKKFDFIFLDTPAIIPVADACIVAAQAQAALMVVRSGRTQRGIVRHAAEMLGQANAPVAGYILTNVEYYIPHYFYRYV